MTISLDAISLPEDLDWTDRYKGSSVSQSRQFTLTGALIIQESVKQAGREITLISTDNSGWALKPVVDAIQAKAETADLIMTLDYFGQTFNVMFRRDQAAFEAVPVVPFSDPQNDDYFRLTLNLITV